jgi:rRNA maturation endonuclease Nob1
MCDAIRYFFVNKFDQAKYVATTLDSFNYGRMQEKGMQMRKCGECKKTFPTKDANRHICNACKELTNASTIG